MSSPQAPQSVIRRPKRESVIRARVTDDMKREIDALAIRRDLDPSDIVREAVRTMLDKHPTTPRPEVAS